MSYVIKSSKNIKQMKINCCVYAGYKVGKNRLSTTVDNALVITMEDGMLSCAGEDVDYIDNVKKHSDLMDLIRAIDSSDEFKKHKWIFLDTITEFGQLLYPPLFEKMNKEAIDNGSKGADGRKVWGKYAQMIGEVVKALRALDKHTCILAHPAEKEVDGVEKRTVDLYGKSAQNIIGWLDEIFYMHVNDKGETVFLTQATDRTVAGDRSGKLDKFEPADLGHIQRKILG